MEEAREDCVLASVARKARLQFVDVLFGGKEFNSLEG